ncbi:MAG: epoxyqueuosine reductase QueH [Synergistaceae bacterium]|nr:epoxyqueuosine reductase QueH [Synergistaceae bacterium]
MKNILLHICCAPDGSVPIPDLIAEGWNVIGFFYGSNIHPFDEYYRRLGAIRTVIAHNSIACEISPYSPEEWLSKIHGLENEPEGGQRCTECFKTQLTACASTAKELGCEYISTTLTISPHKNVALINGLGEMISSSHGLKWENRIWRKNNGFLRSVKVSKELGLYRQNYCGCTFSKKTGIRNYPNP